MTRITVAIVAATVVAISLTGCVSFQLPGQVVKTAPAEQPVDLSFEKAADIPAKASPTLTDTLSDEDGWTLADATVGQREYRTPDGLCDATVHTGAVPDDVTLDGDDRGASDRYLAHLFGASQDKVSAIAKDVAVAPDAQFRQVSGSDTDGSKWSTAARIFTVPSVAVFADLNCKPGADADVFMTVLLSRLEMETR